MWQLARFTIPAASTARLSALCNTPSAIWFRCFRPERRSMERRDEGKAYLPRPLARRVRRFPGKRERKVDTAKPVFEILLVLCFDSHQMPTQRFTQIQRKYRDAVFPTFRVAHGDLCERKIDVLYSQPDTFHQPQPATV